MANIVDDQLAKNLFSSNAQILLHIPNGPLSVVEVYIQERRRLAFSIREGDIVLHRYEPGLLENWFGVDNEDDSTPFISVLFANESDPAWARFMESGLSKWPPRLNLEDRDPTAPM